MQQQNKRQKVKSPICFYTFGRAEMQPQLCTGKDGKTYYNVKVTLFGGWSGYALVHKPEQVTVGAFVGVRVKPKKDSKPSYVIFPLDGVAKDFISAAACSLPNVEIADVQTCDDFDDELPF